MTLRDEISSLLEEARVRSSKAANASTYEARQRQAQAIDMLVTQALKLIEAEWNALMAEVADAEKVNATTEAENERIRDMAHSQHVEWRTPTRDWRGVDDY